MFPFVVVEPTATIGQPLPLWVMLHGGGVGYFAADGSYVGATEAHNDAESTKELVAMVLRFTGADGMRDTFIGDRVRAGDRVVLGSLCDHDLYAGLGQPYPNDPNHPDTVDGLLAALAMVDAVTEGTATVQLRPTTSRWILGTSAGSYGAYELAHQLWARHEGVAGVIMDSGLITSRTQTLLSAAALPQSGLDTAQLTAKIGPYAGDAALWPEHAVAVGFDVPLFDTVEVGDAGCGGAVAPVDGAVAAGYADNCSWLHGALGEAIEADGDPATQWVRTYPGTTHTASDLPGTQLQRDLRSWYSAVV